MINITKLAARYIKVTLYLPSGVYNLMEEIDVQRDNYYAVCKVSCDFRHIVKLSWRVEVIRRRGFRNVSS